jgi:hypothetical protein
VRRMFIVSQNNEERVVEVRDNRTRRQRALETVGVTLAPQATTELTIAAKLRGPAGTLSYVGIEGPLDAPSRVVTRLCVQISFFWGGRRARLKAHDLIALI